MKTSRIYLFILLSSVAIAGNVWGQDINFEDSLMVVVPVLNLRENPSVNSSIVTKLKYGDILFTVWKPDIQISTRNQAEGYPPVST